MLNTVLFVLIALGDAAPPEWQLKKDKDGIAVHTRQVAGSDIAEFKAVMSLENTSLTKVLDVITDVKGYVDLFPDCSEARILAQEGRYNTIHYLRTDAPFPVSDRDGIYRVQTQISGNGTKAYLTLSVLPDYLPVTEGIVRVPGGAGFWQLEQVGKKVKVIYQFHGDPGGKVPAWLANSFIVDHPYKTMENLRKLVGG